MTPTICNRARRVGFALLALACTWMTPLVTLASHSSDDDIPSHDARIDNYHQKVLLDGGSNALTWFLLLFLAALCVGVMFKSSNRTHLD